MATILDITELLNNPIRTGIQRVVRELIRNWPDPEGVQLARFDPDCGLISVPSTILPLITEDDEASKKADPQMIRRLIETELSITQPQILPPNGTILVPELFYESKRCAFYRQALRDDCDAAAFIVYDFIPWLYPDHIGVRSTVPLMPYLQVLRDASHVSFISGRTARDYSRRIRHDVRSRGPVLPLGADGLSIGRQLFSPERKSWVSIGSIDGRKNQDKILSAFHHLWSQGFSGELVLIGRVFDLVRPGWEHAWIDHPNLKHLADVPDEVINAEMRRARATIYLSDLEGFGLPPVESLNAGIPVIATSGVPSLQDCATSGQIRIASADVKLISEAVLASADDAIAEQLWREAGTLVLPSWRTFARNAFDWISSI